MIQPTTWEVHAKTANVGLQIRAFCFLSTKLEGMVVQQYRPSACSQLILVSPESEFDRFHMHSLPDTVNPTEDIPTWARLDTSTQFW